MFNAYGDLVIMRHTETEAPPAEILRNLRVPLINAGNGSGEHPTQALADWYALLKWRTRPRRRAEPPREAAARHPGHAGFDMRAVKSFLLTSLLFQDAHPQVTVISEMADPFGAEVMEDSRRPASNTRCPTTSMDVLEDPRRHLHELDRLPRATYQTLDASLQAERGEPLKPDAVILHPLARLDELDTDRSISTEHNLYFSQAHGAVFVRQALLISVLGRLDRLPRDSTS
jgi:aspartate carbamoyltransferase catalytic subunit